MPTVRESDSRESEKKNNKNFQSRLNGIDIPFHWHWRVYVVPIVFEYIHLTSLVLIV